VDAKLVDVAILLEDFPLLAHVPSEISRDLGVELRPARRQGDDIVWLSAGCTNQDPSMLFMPIAFQHPVPSQEVPFVVLLTKVRFESKIDVSPTNPDLCTPRHRLSAHDQSHVHGPGCGHEAVPHGDHVDYWVDGHLHHPHGDHCDDHGPLSTA
jgi:hypothetical protein